MGQDNDMVHAQNLQVLCALITVFKGFVRNMQNIR
jgi:hypothetical protein